MENGRMIPRLDAESCGENQNNWHLIFTTGQMQMDTLIVYAHCMNYTVVSRI